MIDLTQYPKIASSQNSNFHIDSKLVAIHGINVFTNIKDNLTSFITANETNINLSGTWTGYVGFITINDEILYVTSATGHNLTVIRAQQGTVALNHSLNSLVYTIDIFKTISSYNWSQSIGITDRDLFSIEIDSGRIVINDLSKNWNKLYEGCLYNFKRNKEVFIWEGCNEQVTKVWEGLTKDKNDSSESNEIIIELTGYFNKFADEPIKPLKIYDNIRPKEMLEDLFKGYSAKYIGNTIITDYFKIYNLSTGDFTTYRDFINYICKEYAIHLLFRKDKTIHIISDMYPNKITPIDTIQTEITKINNDSSGNIIINSISGTYKERKALRNEKYTPVRFRKNKSFVAPALPKDITIDGVFQEISLTGLSYAEINTMTYQEYLLLEESITDRRYMCKLTDIIKIADNNYTIKILVGYDKASYWNERGRTLLQGYYLSLTNAYKLYWSYDEFPIIYKYGRNIDGEDSTSNLMFPLYPNEDYVFYIENFGVSDTSVSKFSGIVKGFETLVGNTYDNTSLFYNDEYKQNLTVPIYLYTNKISSSHPLSNDIICIGSIDNSDVTLKIEYSDIKESLYKVTIKNTLLGIPTKTITPIVTMTGQRLLKLSLADYNECEVGDALKLQEILASDPKYQTYLTFKDARYLITSKFIDDDGEYYITLNDYYPMAEGTEFTFIKYIRDNIILLNELYFRANPVMEAEINYEYNHDESIIEYGTKEYTIEGKSIQKNDFLKITAYLKDTYNGVNINGIRNKIRAEMMRRVDLEAGDVIYLTDTAQTQYINQKCLITKKEVNVTTNGERDESYEMITVGNYEINPNVLLSQNILSWKPDVTPSFNHTGTEGKTTQEQNKQASNKRIVLQDSVEGQIYVDEIPQSVFYATTDLTGTITSDKQTFELGLKGLATGEYRNSLLRAGTEGVVKVNSEYLSYRSLGYNAIANTARIHIIKRGIGNTKQGDITSNIRVQFYKIIAKISAEGLKSTDVSMGDGTDNYVEIHTSTGVAIKSNKVIDISNLYNTLKFDSTDNSSYITMNNGAIKLGKNAVDGNKDGVWIKGSNDENYIKFNTTDNYVDIKCQRGRVGSATNYFDITNGLIYMNGGKQQLGAGVTDSGGTFDGFFVGDTTLSNNRYLKYNGTTFTLKTSDGYIGNATNYFDITSGKLNIGTAGKIRVASTDNVATTLFQIGEMSGNYLKYDTVGGLSSSGNFNVVGGSINLTTIDTYNRIFFDATNSIIELNKNDTSTNWRFQIGKNSSSANYILFDSGNAIIKSNNINLYKDANNSLIMNSTTSSISLYQSATNKFTFDLTNGVEIITTKGKLGSATSYFDITNKAFVLGTEGILTVGSGSNLLSWDNTNGAIFKTNKIVDIQNTNNKLYFDNTGYSYLRMNSNTQQIGRVTGLTGKVDFDGFYFGDIVLANNKHIYYDGTNFVIKGNVSVSGGSIDISNTNSTILFDANNSVIQLNKAGASTTSKLEINQSSDSYYFLFDKANAIIKTAGNVTISNTNNALFFETGATLNSYIRMNTNSIQLGKLANLTGTYGLTLNTTNGIFVGNTNTDLNKFMSYNGTDLQIKTDKGYIGGSLATSTYFDITNGSFQLYKSATDNLAFTTAGGLIIKSANVTVNTSSDNNYLNLTPTNSVMYLGKAGTNVDIQIGASSGNHINFLNGALDIKTSKINITDIGNTSLISLNSGAEQIGTGITLSGWTIYDGIFVGDTTIANENYIKYDIGNQRFTFGDNVQIAGVIKTGDSIIVQNIGANTVVKCGEIDKINNIFGFDYTSPTNPTTEYFRLADATGGVYTQGLTLKTQGTVDISNGSGGTLNKLYFNPTANTSYLSMNGGTQQIGRVSSITGKSDYNGIFIGNTTIANNKHLYYDGTNFKIAGDVALSASSTIDSSATIGGSTVSVVVSNASNGNAAYTGTANLRTNNPPTNNAIFGTITDVATSDGNIVVTIPYNYTQGVLKADSILIYIREGGGTVTTANVAYITKAITGSMTFTLKPSTVYRFGLQAIRTSDTGTQAFATIAQSSNFTTSVGNYTSKIDTSNVANKLYWGSDIKIGKDAYDTNKDGISITTNGYLNVANKNNRLFFDPTSYGDNSFIGLNKATTYYSAQIGKVQENSTGSILSYNGFFFGNPESESSEYLKYSTNSGMEFKGKYFNETAYVSTDVEFIGACDTNKETILKYDGSGNLTISKANPFYGKTIKSIILTAQIDITSININHWVLSGYIYPMSSIREISSNSPLNYLQLGNSTSNISQHNFGIYLSDPIILKDLEINLLGSDIELSGVKYGIYIVSDNVQIVHCTINNLRSKIYSLGQFNNVSIENSKLNLNIAWNTCFEGFIYMSSLHINISLPQDVVNLSTTGIFTKCKNITNVYVNSTSNKAQLFYDCNNISNIYINNFTGIIAASSKNMNNIFLDHYTPYTFEDRALFAGIVNLNNFRCPETISGTAKVFFNAVQVTNCSVVGVLPIHIDYMIKDKNNSWNDVVVTSSTAYTLKRDDVMLNSNQSAPVIHTLPLANLYHENRIYTIKDVAGNAKTNNITIRRQGSDTIDGLTSVVINANYGSMSFYSDGTTWRRLISPTIFGY